jgi:hypothetical protein
LCISNGQTKRTAGAASTITEPIVPVRSQLPPEIFEASFGLEVRNRDRLAVDGVTPQAELTLGYLGGPRGCLASDCSCRSGIFPKRSLQLGRLLNALLGARYRTDAEAMNDKNS